MIKELQIPSSLGFCKKCFRSRRDGSQFCGQCTDSDNAKRIPVFISTDQFPLLHKVVRRFNILGATDLDHIVFTYGNVIYARMDMPFHLVAHEITHVFQQLMTGKDKWWKKYLKDDRFRLDQEVQAYQQQYKVAKQKNEMTGSYVLEKVSKDLSSRLYGNIIGFEEAKKLISGEK